MKTEMKTPNSDYAHQLQLNDCCLLNYLLNVLAIVINKLFFIDKNPEFPVFFLFQSFIRIPVI